MITDASIETWWYALQTQVGVIKEEDVVTHSSVLIDGQTLLAVRELADVVPPRRDLQKWLAAYPITHFIQNVVIHETLLVDSQLLLADYKCLSVCSRLPGAFKA